MVRQIFTIILLLTALTLPAYADGMVFERRVDYSALATEESQTALIAYEDGIERLIIGVDVHQTQSELVWIFPVPAKPDVTDIDIVKSLPKLEGKNVIDEAKKNAQAILEVSLISQIYTLPLIFTARGASFGHRAAVFEAVEPSSLEGLIVYKSITKYGITTELLSTESIEPLEFYLLDKGLELPDQVIGPIEEYIGEDCSFVISWKESTAFPRGKTNNINVTISFPTERIFYPLRFTSVYGEEVIPIQLTVQGYVTPDVPKPLDRKVKAYFFRSDESNEVTIHKSDGDEEDILFERMTLIKLRTASKELISDLWLEPKPMFGVRVAESIYLNPVQYFIVSFLLISFVSGEVAGLIMFPNARSWLGILRCGLLGLTNILTLFVVFLAAVMNVRHFNYGFERASGFTVIFSVLFVILNLVIWSRFIQAFS
jgi:hypothetical protein